TGIANLVIRHAVGKPDGLPIDVLSLSMGYYHETPYDALFDPTMYEILASMGRCGTVVVVSAGNDATNRPMFPAAFAPWDPARTRPGDVDPLPERDPDAVPIVAVGALNPAGTDALFSNDGPWVRARERGAAVVGTMPAFSGGAEPLARTVHAGRQRETIDPDDFRGGFAVWSGTSFAAPVTAGRVAHRLLGQVTEAVPD